MLGVEAAGHGLDGDEHAASLLGGAPGVLHGNKTYLLQDETVRSRRGTRSALASITPASAPNTLG